MSGCHLRTLPYSTYLFPPQLRTESPFAVLCRHIHPSSCLLAITSLPDTHIVVVPLPSIRALGHLQRLCHLWQYVRGEKRSHFPTSEQERSGEDPRRRDIKSFFSFFLEKNISFWVCAFPSYSFCISFPRLVPFISSGPNLLSRSTKKVAPRTNVLAAVGWEISTSYDTRSCKK